MKASAHLNLQSLIDKQFPTTTPQGGVRVQVIESQFPIDLIIEETRRYDLMILGLADAWNLKNVSIFGKHESVAQRADCSLLIVHASPNAPVVTVEPTAPQTMPKDTEVATVSTG